jgi:hypothetical protein
MNKLYYLFYVTVFIDQSAHASTTLGLKQERMGGVDAYGWTPAVRKVI